MPSTNTADLHNLSQLHPKDRGRPRGVTRTHPPNYAAEVKSYASHSLHEQSPSVKIDKKLLETIRNCLNLGDETRNTSQHEAEQALRVATRLMQQHNVKMADVVRHAAQSGEPSHIAGKSIVRIAKTNSSKAKTVPRQYWTRILASAVSVVFNCKSISQVAGDRRSVKWTFYGIAGNTEEAAISFCTVHNLVAEWAAEEPGIKNDYCQGVAAGLEVAALDEQKRQLRQLKDQERGLLPKIPSTQDQKLDNASSSPVEYNQGHSQPNDLDCRIKVEPDVSATFVARGEDRDTLAPLQTDPAGSAHSDDSDDDSGGGGGGDDDDDNDSNTDDLGLDQNLTNLEEFLDEDGDIIMVGMRSLSDHASKHVKKDIDDSEPIFIKQESSEVDDKSVLNFKSDQATTDASEVSARLFTHAVPGCCWPTSGPSHHVPSSLALARYASCCS